MADNQWLKFVFPNTLPLVLTTPQEQYKNFYTKLFYTL